MLSEQAPCLSREDITVIGYPEAGLLQGLVVSLRGCGSIVGDQQFWFIGRHGSPWKVLNCTEVSIKLIS